jgi:hypothetical protein
VFPEKIEMNSHAYGGIVATNINNSIETTMAMAIAEETGIGRMTDDDYDMEYGTPRPKGDHPPSEPLCTMVGEPFCPLTFTKSAAVSAAEHKCKRFATTRTEYRMNNKHVAKAFDMLEAAIQRQGETMSSSDFRMLKQAICNFRVRIIVHDSMTFAGLKKMQAKCAAELVEHTAMVQALAASPCPSESATIDAKIEFMSIQNDKNNDLVHWNTTLSNEIFRMTTGEAHRVPSQHVQLERSSGITLQNILSPQTVRRKFISLSAMTNAIRADVQLFLTSPARGKDRATVFHQIMKSIAASKKKPVVSAAH